MRGEMSINIERALEGLWKRAAATVPEWLPMRYIDWLPSVYEIALGISRRCQGAHEYLSGAARLSGSGCGVWCVCGHEQVHSGAALRSAQGGDSGRRAAY